MRTDNIYIGSSKVISQNGGVSGQFVELEGEKYYQIQNYHEMKDFFISVVSDSDHWMFISSNGALSAGRKDRDNALFPYYTDDKIHDYRGITGSSSVFLVEKSHQNFLWEPFSNESLKFYDIKRNIYKSVYGNSLVFEEINHDLGLSFRYAWHNSEKFGFVKKSSLSNLTNEAIQIKFVDGIKNLMPYGVDSAFQNEYSNLLDAYKKSERIDGTTLGMFMLSAIPVDRAEPSEALKTTTVWSLGDFENLNTLISDQQIAKFKQGKELDAELDIRASRGAYFVNAQIELNANSQKDWLIIAEINIDSTQLSNLKQFISQKENIEELIWADIKKGTDNLKKLVSYADGFQMTNTELCSARHYSNTLFNIMRGGVFANNYSISTEDFKHYLGKINISVYEEYLSWLNRLPEDISYMDLLVKAKEFNNADLLRIVYEYLPLTFSRRHGDPSRPWNQFSVETKNEDGSLKYNYQGNWRDIFQNWEALSYSFPEFLEGIISKFVNASTIDGYNPYRIMRDGIDWESPNPDDPWAYIGYWGDHQIIYLQKLLELSDQFHPEKLDKMLSQEVFTYANVPYHIKTYDEIVKNPKDTIVFDHELNKKINDQYEFVGADAKLLYSNIGSRIYKVNLSEKILITMLSKLSNFIPDAGIWLNTQRPEWNDANNALVGNGTSMVTLYYLRRFLKFWAKKFKSSNHLNLSVSEEVAKLFRQLNKVFKSNQKVLENGFSDMDRKTMTDALGIAHSQFRSKVYESSFSGKKKEITTKDLKAFCDLCLTYIDQSIENNKREDGLYHAYNLITFHEDALSIRNLYEMLEGQVAILSSGFLSAQESLNVLDALKKSDMYREDQFSYMLYPNRELPRFVEKNNIPKELLEQSELLKKLLKDSKSNILKKDQQEQYHFNGAYTNAGFLNDALNHLDMDKYGQLLKKEREIILDMYEQIFDHKSFTGRSGTFYGYEGLGSIYWHMVSKLLLATQESFMAAIEREEETRITNQLKAHYYEIKAGIGLYKSPDLYGAFPTDAYSHTPLNSGVKQPGLTGQVKEDVISRFGEIGLQIKDGKIGFNPALLNEEEILCKAQNFEYINLEGESQSIPLTESQIAFTFCQVPFVYTFGKDAKTILHFDSSRAEIKGNKNLSAEHSQSIFLRNNQIKLVEITFNK